jgi:hypothetical protein
MIIEFVTGLRMLAISKALKRSCTNCNTRCRKKGDPNDYCDRWKHD